MPQRNGLITGVSSGFGIAIHDHIIGKGGHASLKA